jgi:putative ABC transport system permease protein
VVSVNPTLLVARRGIAARKAFSAAVAVLAALLTLLVASVLTAVIDNGRVYDAAYRASGSPDAVLSVPDTDWLPGDADELRRMPEIAKVDVTTAYLASIDGRSGLPTIVTFVPASSLGSLRTQDGARLAVADGDVMLPLSLRSSLGLAVGARASFAVGNSRREFRVAGYFEDPVFGSPIMRYKRVPLAAADLGELAASAQVTLPRTTTFVTLRYRDRADDTAAVTDAVLARFSGRYRAEFAYDKGFVRKAYTMIPTVLSALIGVVALALTVILVLVIRFVAVTSIEMDRRQIATMKAIGFRAGQIRAALTGQFALLAGVGAVIGAAGSLLAAPALTGLFLAADGIRASDARPGPVPAVVALAVVVIAMTAVRLATRSVRRVRPVEAVRDGVPVGSRRRSPARVSLARLSRLPLGVRVAAHAVLTGSGQYVALGLSCLCFGFLLLSVGGLAVQFSDPASVGRTLGLPGADLSVTVLDQRPDPDTVADRAVAVLNGHRRVGAVSSFDQRAITADGDDAVAMIVGSFADWTRVSTGRAPREAGEVMLADSLASRLHRTVGDRVELSTGRDARAEFTVTGIYQSVTNVGLTLQIGRDGYQRLRPDYRATQYLVDFADDADSAQIDESIAWFGSRDPAVRVERGDRASANLVATVQRSLNLLVGLMLALALLVSCVITLFLALTAVTRERRDLGVMKAIGYSTRSLRRQVTGRFVLVAATATLLGEALAGALGAHLFSAVLAGAGLSRLDVSYGLAWPAAVLAFGVACAGFVAHAATRPITAIQPSTLAAE